MDKSNQNLNNTYYKTLDENFKNTLILLEADLTQEEITALLENGNIAEKQIAALKLTRVNNFDEALILTRNLTGQDGKIREAVSLKINELIKNPQFSCYFYDIKIYDIFLRAVIDVNSNVCRNIISAIKILKNNADFCIYFTNNLIELTNKLLEKVKEFNFQEGKYKVNKEVFKLYWCLEAIYEFTDCIELEILKSILRLTKDIDEYTIREKTAKILSKDFNDEELHQIRQHLKNDKNYYVRRF